MGSLTILNECGDTTIEWSSDRDEEMAEIIKKKMAEGVSFFIITERGLRHKADLSYAAELERRQGSPSTIRHLAIPDEDFHKFVAEGKGTVVKADKTKIAKSRKSSVPAEVAKADSVGVRQMRGG